MGKNDKDEVKEWMETHPQEYAQFAAKMNDQGISSILKLGEEAFLSSPTFKQEVEKIVATGQFDTSILFECLSQSDFAANYFKGKDDDRMAMAAWIKYGESPELIIEELDRAMVAQGKRKYRNLLSKLLRLFWDRFFQRRCQQRAEHHVANRQTPIGDSLQSLLASQDEGRVKRIGEWASCRCSGMDIAHLFVALVETGEISAKMPLTQFLDAMKVSYPKNTIVGVRQLQKSVNYLQNLSPNKKQYGKDETEHRFAIESIKTEVISINMISDA